MRKHRRDLACKILRVFDRRQYPLYSLSRKRRTYLSLIKYSQANLPQKGSPDSKRKIRRKYDALTVALPVRLFPRADCIYAYIHGPYIMQYANSVAEPIANHPTTSKDPSTVKPFLCYASSALLTRPKVRDPVSLPSSRTKGTRGGC